MRRVLCAGEAASQRKLTCDDIFVKVSGGWEFTQGLKTFDGQSLLGEAACEQSTDCAAVTIQERTNGHEFNPKLCGCLDEDRCGRICIKNFMKLPQAVFELENNPVA